MINKFYAGQRVICINDQFEPGICEWADQLPKIDHVYTIVSVNPNCPHRITGAWGTALLLEELSNPEDRIGFSEWRFVPVVLAEVQVEEMLAVGDEELISRRHMANVISPDTSRHRGTRGRAPKTSKPQPRIWGIDLAGPIQIPLPLPGQPSPSNLAPHRKAESRSSTMQCRFTATLSAMWLQDSGECSKPPSRLKLTTSNPRSSKEAGNGAVGSAGIANGY